MAEGTVLEVFEGGKTVAESTKELPKGGSGGLEGARQDAWSQQKIGTMIEDKQVPGRGEAGVSAEKSGQPPHPEEESKRDSDKQAAEKKQLEKVPDVTVFRGGQPTAAPEGVTILRGGRPTPDPEGVTILKGK